MEENLVPKQQYTEGFKTEAARLAESVGQHLDQADVALGPKPNKRN